MIKNKLESLNSTIFKKFKVGNSIPSEEIFGLIICTRKNQVPADHYSDATKRDTLTDNNGNKQLVDYYNEPCAL